MSARRLEAEQEKPTEPDVATVDVSDEEQQVDSGEAPAAAGEAPDLAPPADEPDPDDERPVWNVETHGKPDAEQAKFYRVING